MYENLYFLVEGGKALELVKQVIQQREEVRKTNVAYCEKLGVKRYVPSTFTHNLIAVVFDGEIHPDFKKPNKNGASYPKKKTQSFEEIAALPSCENMNHLISKELCIPCEIAFKNETKEISGRSCIGSPFYECQFYWMSYEGPYLLQIPNVPFYVQDKEKDGFIVAEPAKSFIPEFEGCTRILLEEWKLLVAQKKLEDQKVGHETL